MQSRKQGRRKTNFKPSKEVTHVRRQLMKKQKRQEQPKEAAMESDPECEVLNLLETIEMLKEPNVTMTKEQLERDAEEFDELEQKIAKRLGSWKYAVSD